MKTRRRPDRSLMAFSLLTLIVFLLGTGWFIKTAPRWMPEKAEPYTASATAALAMVTLVLVFVTGALAFAALREFREAQRISSFDFLLRIDETFSTPQNMDIANKVVEEGSYGDKTSIEDWNNVRRYMG